MSDDDEIQLEFGPAGAGVLSSGVAISMRKGEGEGSWDVEVALDVAEPAEGLLVSPDGCLGILHALVPTSTEAGTILYATFNLVMGGHGLILEVLGPDGVPVEALTCYVRTDRRQAFGLMRLPAGDSPGPLWWGPAGAQRWNGAVNLAGGWSGSLGIALDLLMDDLGLAVRVGGACQPAGRPLQAWILQQSMALLNPGLARLWLPPGTSSADLTFFDSSGDELPAYRHTLDLLALPQLDPRVAMLAPPRARPQSPGSLGGEADMDQLPHAAPPLALFTGGIPPSATESTQAGTITTGGLQPATDADSLPSRTPTTNGAGSAVTTSLLGVIQAPPTKSEDGSSSWPASLGTRGKVLGATCRVTHKPVLTLLSFERSDEALILELQLVDRGTVSTMVLAMDGKVVADVAIERVTPTAPVRIHAEVARPPEGKSLVLMARNLYGETYEDLTAALSVATGEFEPYSPDVDVWGALLRPAGKLDLEWSLCVACRVELRLDKDIPLTELDSPDRERLREQFASSSETRGICEPCHRTHVLSKQWTYILFEILSGSSLMSGLERLIACYIGALLATTASGAWIGSAARTVLGGRLPEGDHLAVASFLGAVVIGLVPWGMLAPEVARSWRRTLTAGRTPGRSALVVTALAAGWIALVTRTRVPFPEGLESMFWQRIIHRGAMPAWGLVSLVAWLAQGAVAAAIEKQMRPQQALLRQGNMSRLVPRLLSVTTLHDFERSIDRILLDGMGALEFQVFALNEITGRYKLWRSVGPVRHQVMGLDFPSGAPNILGLVAKLGRPVSIDEVMNDPGIDVAYRKAPIPSMLVFPVWSRGKVHEIYNISRLRHPEGLAELVGQVRVFSVVAGRGLAQVNEASQNRKRR